MLIKVSDLITASVAWQRRKRENTSDFKNNARFYYSFLLKLFHCLWKNNQEEEKNGPYQQYISYRWLTGYESGSWTLSIWTMCLSWWLYSEYLLSLPIIYGGHSFASPSIISLHFHCFFSFFFSKTYSQQTFFLWQAILNWSHCHCLTHWDFQLVLGSL